MLTHNKKTLTGLVSVMALHELFQQLPRSPSSLYRPVPGCPPHPPSLPAPPNSQQWVSDGCSGSEGGGGGGEGRRRRSPCGSRRSGGCHSVVAKLPSLTPLKRRFCLSRECSVGLALILQTLVYVWPVPLLPPFPLPPSHSHPPNLPPKSVVPVISSVAG